MKLFSYQNESFLCFLCCNVKLSFVLFQCQSKNDGKKEMQTLAVANFSLPGDSGFPLNAMYQKPGSKAEAGYKAHQ